MDRVRKPTAGVGTGPQQAACQLQQAVQRGEMQRAEAARVLGVERDTLVEQMLHRRQHHILVARGAGLGACAEQQQQRRHSAGGRRVDLGTGQQQRVEQREQARAIARGETVEGRAMQRRQALGIGRVDVRAGREQARRQIRKTERGGEHQYGHLAGQALLVTGTGFEQDGLALTVLWPDSAEAAERASAAERGSGEGDAANDCSIALEARWADGTRLVTLGDLEPAAQEQLAATEPGPADIVKVAHHGSRFQHAPLYEQLAPDLALVPVGQENTFGHPTDELLDLVRGTGAQVLRTDVHGTVVLPTGEDAAPRSVGPAR